MSSNHRGQQQSTENKTVSYFENEVGPDQECSSPVFNKHTICKNFTQPGQNRQIISCAWFSGFFILQHSCLLNARPEYYILIFANTIICNIPYFTQNPITLSGLAVDICQNSRGIVSVDRIKIV